MLDLLAVVGLALGMALTPATGAAVLRVFPPHQEAAEREPEGPILKLPEVKG
jgi:hypothetical protein